jgi:hypothetical protein
MDDVPRHLQHVVSKRCARRGDVCVVWATAASWVLSVEKRNGGGVADLLAAPAPPSLSNDHGLLFVVVITAADGGNGMRRYRQTSWHVRKVPLMCHVVTAMC